MNTTDPVGTTASHRRTAKTIGPDELPELARTLLNGGFRVALIAGHDDEYQLRAVYLFTAARDRRVELTVPLDRSHPHVPTLARQSFSAGRLERAMRDLFGIVPAGHPLPRRLVRHDHWTNCRYTTLKHSGSA